MVRAHFADMLSAGIVYVRMFFKRRSFQNIPERRT
jgi:hypothetical protein